MKKYPYLFSSFGLIIIVVLLTAFGGGELKYSSGAPPGYTNSPADVYNCTHCMGGSAVPVIGWITSDVPVSGYIAGTTYTITVTATGSGKKGFEVSPQDSAGNLIGTLIAGTGNKLVGTGKYVTHSSTLNSNPATWHFQWKAPDPGVGDVIFYGSVAVTQNATKTTTLTVSQSTVGISSLELTNVKLYPNPCIDKVNLSFSLNTATPVTIDLLSLDGKVIKTLVSENSTTGDHSYQFGLDQPAGLYLLQIRTSGGTKMLHLVKG